MRGEISGSTGQVLKILTIFFILVVHVLKITPLLILISTIVIVNLPSPPNWRSRSWISLPEHLQGYPLKNWSQSLYIPNRNSIPEHSQGQAPLDLSLKAFWDGNEQWIKSPEICMLSNWSYKIIDDFAVLLVLRFVTLKQRPCFSPAHTSSSRAPTMCARKQSGW